MFDTGKNLPARSRVTRILHLNRHCHVSCIVQSDQQLFLEQTGDMAVTVEMQNTGDSRTRREILAGVEHVLSDVAGEWRVSIVGSRANDNWEMKVEGPQGFERSYTLVG